MLSISFAMVFPMVIVLVLLVVQAALIWYSDNVALTAARVGADAARVYGTTDNTPGKSRAEAFLAPFAALVRPEVRVPDRQKGDTTVTVTVTVHPLFVLPGELTFSETAQAPLERYNP
ncbi:TadE/TadG family type IV pilus assembly protein [Kitasatospora viridis]|uniref:TadE-like protein n=1 Tax=Kitasatospora viridis TaxID=281105 RepID=A0A561UAT5_9ACTN|nr:TadE/TadG family type IV pilus assembly protein [Kitasatospora viridis]TWF96460.1 TadE-like protein [Kitasatospora viridis]